MIYHFICVHERTHVLEVRYCWTGPLVLESEGSYDEELSGAYIKSQVGMFYKTHTIITLTCNTNSETCLLLHHLCLKFTMCKSKLWFGGKIISSATV